MIKGLKAHVMALFGSSLLILVENYIHHRFHVLLKCLVSFKVFKIFRVASDVGLFSLKGGIYRKFWSI